MLVNERMEREHLNKIRLIIPRTGKPPTIEFDPKIDAGYIRFAKGKIVKSLSPRGPGPVAVVDLDASNRAIGLEFVGVKWFSIDWLRRNSPFDVSRVDFERAKFVHAANREEVEA